MVRRYAPTHDSRLASEGCAQAPLVRLTRRHESGEIHARDAGKLAGVFDSCIDRLLAGHDAAGLCAFVANNAGQLARVDLRNSDRVALLQKI